VEEVDPVLDVVLNDHALRIAADQRGGWPIQLVCQQQCRLLVAQVGDRQLPQWTDVVIQSDAAIENPQGLVGARDATGLSERPSFLMARLMS
jgi:hypothetical protein